jgi:hypothetical protein
MRDFGGGGSGAVIERPDDAGTKSSITPSQPITCSNENLVSTGKEQETAPIVNHGNGWQTLSMKAGAASCCMMTGLTATGRLPINNAIVRICAIRAAFSRRFKITGAPLREPRP